MLMYIHPLYLCAVYGRWRKNLKPEVNLGIETALLSRFDLTFVILGTYAAYYPLRVLG